MYTEMTTKRGMESALYACPTTVVATSGVERQGRVSGAVMPFRGRALSFAGSALDVIAPDAVGTTRSNAVQLVPFHPGATARRPPA